MGVPVDEGRLTSMDPPVLKAKLGVPPENPNLKLETSRSSTTKSGGAASRILHRAQPKHCEPCPLHPQPKTQSVEPLNKQELRSGYSAGLERSTSRQGMSWSIWEFAVSCYCCCLCKCCLPLLCFCCGLCFVFGVAFAAAAAVAALVLVVT